MYSSHIRRTAVSLLDSGLTFSEVSRRLEIHRATLRTWFRHRELIDKYQHLGTCVRCAPLPRAPEPAPSYSYLLGLYLGDGFITYAGDSAKRVWALRITCANTWPGLVDECVRTLEAILPGHRIGIVDKIGCKDVIGRWKHWPCLFPQCGAGRKHSRRIVLETWQEKIVNEHPREFLRGLIHSDGCRVTNRVRRMVAGRWRYYQYPRYFFSNTSTDIVGMFCDALDLLDIGWRIRVQPKGGSGYKGYGHRDAHIVSIAERSSVAFLDTFIGPKH